MANSVQRIALYARVSTSNSHQDPEMQLRELREYAHRRELQIVEEYIDSGISGSKDSRPALNRLMVDVHSRRCRVGLENRPVGRRHGSRRGL
jgi:DNA invertase Pin-like site-specific DNA recombinase